MLTENNTPQPVPHSDKNNTPWTRPHSNVRVYGSPDIVDLEPFSTVTFRPYIDTVLGFTSHFVGPELKSEKCYMLLYVTLTYLRLYEFGRCSMRVTGFKSPTSFRTRTHSPTHLFLFSWVTFELSTDYPSNNINDFGVRYFLKLVMLFLKS